MTRLRTEFAELIMNAQPEIACAREAHPRAAAGKIESWLLQSKVQLRAGPHRGGVAGWLNQDGTPANIYPEIVGYYLTWLAFLSATETFPGDLALRMQSTLEWVKREFSQGKRPLTRIPLFEGDRDWRNGALFAFDLVMLARGVAAAQQVIRDPDCDRLLLSLVDTLRLFFANPGRLNPCLDVPGTSGMELPHRWSTVEGPHQLKIAAAALTLPRQTISDSLHRAMLDCYKRWREHDLSNDKDYEPHPALYHIEGLVCAAQNGLDPDAWPLINRAYSRLIEDLPWLRTSSFKGRVPAEEQRSDILAQAIRVACILRCNGFLGEPEWRRRLQEMVRLLGHYVSEDGAVAFLPIETGNCCHWNTWSAIFSHQALTYFDKVQTEAALPDSWKQWLV